MEKQRARQESSWRARCFLTCPPNPGPGNMLVSGRRKRELCMAKRRLTPEQVLAKLTKTGAAIAGRSTGAEAARPIGVTGQTFCRRRSESWVAG